MRFDWKPESKERYFKKAEAAVKRNWEAVQVKSNCDMYMICSSHGSHGLRE